MNNQMTFKRYEIKYLITTEQKALLLNEMKPFMDADIHGKSTILSLYLDTPDFLLVRRSLDKPIYKEKLRLRSYGTAQPDTDVFIELKKKYDSVVYKRREAMKLFELESYLKTGIMPKDTQIMREIDFAMKRYAGIAPAVLLSYEREAFYDKYDYDFRMTFDENILWRTEALSLNSPVYGTPILDSGHVLLEVKTAGAMPLWLVHFFSKYQLAPVSFSKYGSAYRALTQKNNAIIDKGGSYKYA